jgi:hypothetical protein
MSDELAPTSVRAFAVIRFAPASPELALLRLLWHKAVNGTGLTRRPKPAATHQPAISTHHDSAQRCRLAC